ncbi:portal protein [Bacterioplanoides sp.]|uniref:portal protein n=1 Tax=Bacterioplanoides sp. TaxID=2066072 RepID=UPI003B00CD72
MITAKRRYSQLVGKRDPYLNRARELAKYTIPSFYPPEGANSHSQFPTPYQSVGSRGVNNLANRLLTTLFPPNEPFFRLTIDDFDLAAIADDDDKRGRIERALATIERTALMEIETRAFRVPMYEALRHLILSGNVLIFQIPNSEAMRVFPLSSYVVDRRSDGTATEIIIKETVAVSKIDENLHAHLKIKKNNSKPLTELEVDRYTRLTMTGPNKYVLYQEVNDVQIPDSRATFDNDTNPFLALRFSRVENEAYGRGFVEEYAGDLLSLEGLSKALVEGAAAKARILFLVNPNSTVDLKEIEEAENLGFANGRSDDISVLSVDKSADFNFALQFAERIEIRLSRAFMLSSSVQRNGERVTAEEIRYMASELENGLGGIFSLLSQELQLPVVRTILREMTTQGKMPEFPEDYLKPQVVTGMEAIGRDLDRSKIDAFMAGISQLGEEAYREINMSDLVQRYAASSGLHTEGLIKTAEQKQLEQQQLQQQQMQALAGDLTRGVAPQLAKAATEQ